MGWWCVSLLTCRKTSLFESLESRQLLSGATDDPAPFAVKINFQPEEATTVPKGYRSDIGRKYGLRANGMTYGWASANEANMRVRNSTNSPDARYDTHGKFSRTQKWELKVANGTYDVRLVAGDAQDAGSLQQFNVEGKGAMDARTQGNNYWVERSIKVKVSDGKLTITSGADASNNRLDFVEIRAVPPTAPSALPITWKQASKGGPINRVESGVVQIGSKVYVMGGYTNGYDATTKRLDIWDLATNTWTRGKDLPGSQTHAGVATDGRFIYWAAGQLGPMFSTNVTNAVWKYDPAKDRWTSWYALPEARFGGGMFFLDNKMHFAGGDDSSRRTAQSDHWVLDFGNAAAGWQTAAPLPFASDHLSHAIVNGRAYFIGGEHDHGVTYVQHDYVYEYNQSKDTWSRKANMPTPKSHFEGNTVVLDGRIFCIAGQIDHEELTNEVVAYDPATDTWTEYTDFPEQRKGGASGVWQGKIYYHGGDSIQVGQNRNTWIGTFA